MTSARVGVVGCGMIADQYMSGMALAGGLKVVACADAVPERARDVAARYGVPRVLAPADLLADDGIDIVVNLTVPASHAEITRAALEHGKAVYTEKPLGVDLGECSALLELAERTGCRIGSAPDTFLGVGLQTARRVIDAGIIGRPVMAVAELLSPGPEARHASPEFHYEPGGGPLLDMGPYYMTALVHLLGSVKRVAAIGTNPSPIRTIGSGPRRGQQFRSSVDTDVHAIGEIGEVTFALTMTFDAPSLAWRLEVVGEEGVLRCPDPDTFDGPVHVRKHGSHVWRELPASAEGTARMRGFGVAELAEAIAESRPHRTDVALSRHVLESLFAIQRAAETRAWVSVESRCERPEPLPVPTPAAQSIR